MQSQTEAELWTSFRESIVSPNSHKPKLTSHEKRDMAQWACRINRREVFSRAYEPSVGEIQEVRRLFDEISDDSINQNEEYANEQQQPHSIVLKRSPVLIEPNSLSNGDGPRMSRAGSMLDLMDKVGKNECPERELILLTNHFVVVKLEWDEQNKHIVSKKMESCVPLLDVEAVLNLNVCSVTSRRPYPCDKLIDDEDEGNSLFDTNEFTFRVLTAPTQSYTFICSSITQRVAWFNAFQYAVIGAYTRTKDLQSSDNKFGWQHFIIRKDIFSAAVCGDEHMLRRCLCRENHIDVNKRDTYGLTALHYAVYYGNQECIEYLLHANADPNVADIYGKTALYYANHCKDCTTKANIEKILRSFGAKQYVNHLTELDEDELSLTSVKNWLSMWMFWVLHFFMCGSSHNPANQ